MIKKMLEIYFIAGTQDTDDLLGVLEEALQAGITCFQFREKGEESLEKNPSKVEEMARACQDLCQQYGVPFIVNDAVDLAVALDADGVHVGQGDMAIEEVREKMGPNKLIGLSTNTLSEYELALATSGVDYVGIGPAFHPRSKQDHEEIIGLDTIRAAMALEDGLPAVAIGGITVENAASVWKTGVDGLAVVSAISQADDISETVQAFKNRKADR